jgi:uncharacterized protein
MQFILIHGAFGSPERNWFPDLKDELDNMGQEVIALQFPVESYNDLTSTGPNYPINKQTLENWLKVFEDEVLPKLNKNEKLVMIGHSLGCVFILHVVEKFKLNLDCAIFVSPFMDELKSQEFWQFDVVNRSFYKTDFDFEKLKNSLGDTYVLYSDNDPYVSKTHSILFANALGSSTILVRKASHLNSEVNMNEFPLIVDLCASRMELSLYQKYLKHRIETRASDKVISKKMKSITLNSEEAMDEGIFHFKNLRKSGFATLVASLEIWKHADNYFESARKAAHRVKNFIRVIIIDNKADLKNEALIELMQKDIEAGIQVYLCKIEEIKDQIKYLDFGIWDDDYVCIVKYNNEASKAEDIELSSKEQELADAHKDRDLIISKSIRVKDLKKDMQAFLDSYK